MFSSRLRFDPINEHTQPNESVSYADRILAESSSPKIYQAPSYKDSILRQYHRRDFEKRATLSYLRLTILNFLQTLYVDPSAPADEPPSTAVIVRMPDENVFQALTVISKDFERCIQSLRPSETISPCELQSIVDLELHKSIPSFVQLLLDGLTLNKATEASPTPTVMSTANTTVHFEKINQHIDAVVQQLDRSHQLLVQTLEKTAFQQRCQETGEQTDANVDFLNDFSGHRSPLEFYSVYTEFTTYAYSLYIAIKSILATLFNKTALLVDNNDNAGARPAGTKKSKKKLAEQQESAVDNENITQLWRYMEKIDCLLHGQWTQVTDNLRQYETWLRRYAKLTDEECDRLEKELEGNTEQPSSRYALLSLSSFRTLTFIFLD